MTDKNKDISPELPVTLRPEAPEDEPFLFSVYASTREEELRVTGWPEEARTTFLTMQFRAMRQGYRTSFPHAEFSIILLNKEAIGRMVIDRGEQEIRLVDIALLPGRRSQGIGTFLICQLLTEAATAKKTVELQVLQNNPAIRLYQKLGFKTIKQSGMYCAMRWQSET